jgi:hypothetical protein
MSKVLRLSANPTYWNASQTQRDEIDNGCGSEGVLGTLVPDSLLGLSISKACSIHDWMYHHGRTDKQRKEADIIFLDNMKKIVNKSDNNSILKYFRKGLAKIYYLGVRIFGNYFFKKKIKPKETAK